MNITDNGNIYISTDLMCGSFTLYVNRLRSGKQIDDSYVVIDGAGYSTAYSYLPDSIYSRLYIVDYFTLLSESRNIKLEEILI